MSGADRPPSGRPGCWLVYAILLGLYLTFRGYHSLDGDQAYRLPLLLHRQDPKLYATDPFVRAIDAFNPHRGYLMVLDLVTRPIGISAGLFVMFALTFAATCFGIDRLARGIWPNLGPGVGILAAGLVLAAKAGNIGTNHIFEAMVLDRQIAFALGWIALAQLIVQPDRGRTLVLVAIALATLVHPSAGLQLALSLCASLAAWSLLGHWSEIRWRSAILWILGLALAVIPGLAVNVQDPSQLLGKLAPSDFWLLSVELQSPQHMLPHLWGMPQWLACLSYLSLAALALGAWKAGRHLAPHHTDQNLDATGPPAARLRLVTSLVVLLSGLAVVWFLIEKRHSLQVTVFQPFRMATIARGIALALLAGRIVMLWRAGTWISRMRAILLAVSVTGDWLMVVVTLAELAVSSVEFLRAKIKVPPGWNAFDAIVFVSMLGLGVNFLGHHDTKYGHLPLLAAISVGVALALTGFLRPPDSRDALSLTWTPARRRAILALAWLAPAAALLASAIPLDQPLARSSLVHGLITRCRFAAVPTDDIERLALWCRAHTPESAIFIGPPGPKTFRLWSQRSLAFNRAASPYHAAGLADWLARFRDHVGFRGDVNTFVHDYLADRHGFEARYDQLSDAERAALALRQGAAYVVAVAPKRPEGRGAAPESENLLELLHVEGRYAVYRVRPELLVQRQR